jgi:hypothetical protein
MSEVLIQESGIPSVNFRHFLNTNCAWAGVRTSNLLEVPYIAQSDAIAMAPGIDSFRKWRIVNPYHLNFPLLWLFPKTNQTFLMNIFFHPYSKM